MTALDGPNIDLGPRLWRGEPAWTGPGPSSVASARPNHVTDGKSAGDPYTDHHDGRDDQEAAVGVGVHTNALQV
jgi:hypothetical protein